MWIWLWILLWILSWIFPDHLNLPRQATSDLRNSHRNSLRNSHWNSHLQEAKFAQDSLCRMPGLKTWWSLHLWTRLRRFEGHQPILSWLANPFALHRGQKHCYKAFSSKRGLFFTVKGPCALPKFHANPPPLFSTPPHRRVGRGTENPSRGSPKRGGGGGEGRGRGVSVWNLGSARGPFTVKKRPLFDENAFNPKSGKEGFGVGNRGQKLNPNIFFSNFSGASGISRQNPGISRQTSLIPWVSRDIPNFLAPTPSRGRPPPHQKIFGLKSLGLGSFFVPEENPFPPTPEKGV